MFDVSSDLYLAENNPRVCNLLTSHNKLKMSSSLGLLLLRAGRSALCPYC